MGNANGHADVPPVRADAGPSSPQEEDPVRFVRKFFDEFLGYLRKKFQERARGLHPGTPSPFWPYVDLPEPAPGTDRFEATEDPVFLALLQYLIETTFKEGLGYPLSKGLVGLFLRALNGDMMGLDAISPLKEVDDPSPNFLAVGERLSSLGHQFIAAGIKWKGVLRVGREHDDSIRPVGYADDETRHSGWTIGIDLGTSNTRAAVDAGGSLESLPDNKGKSTTPSWVAFTEEERLIGEDAQNLAAVNLEGTIFNVKRLIGRKLTAKDVVEDLKFVPYEIVNKDWKPCIKVKMDGGDRFDLSPEDIVSLLLEKIKEDAERALHMIVEDAIVTVPAYFNVDQRRATKDACDKAQLNFVRIINEPTAAAVAYARYKQDGQKNILVCHLGGGTFDVSILVIDNGAFVVLATSGEKLGGEDIDMTIMRHFIRLIRNKHGKDVSRDNQALVKLRRECERAKIALGGQEEVQMEIESLCEGLDFSELLTREQFEELNNDFFMKIVWYLNKTMNNAGLNKDQIDDVVLTGGSCRIPKIRQILMDYFPGKEPDMGLNLDEAARDGAAIIGGTLSQNGWHDTKDLLILDVVPPTIGSGAMNILIHRNIMIPTLESEVFTAYEDQLSIDPPPLYEEARSLREDQGCLVTRVVLGLFAKCWHYWLSWLWCW